jgi:hypothetical protein
MNRRLNGCHIGKPARVKPAADPWHLRAERWITRRLSWLLPLAISLAVAMKLALYR